MNQRCERMSERTSKWPSTSVCILACSGPPGIGELAGIEENVLDAGHQPVEKLGSFRVVEERTTNGGDLDETRQRQGRKGSVGETVVQVEEKLRRKRRSEDLKEDSDSGTRAARL